jgi:hypothetical protein
MWTLVDIVFKKIKDNHDKNIDCKGKKPCNGRLLGPPDLPCGIGAGTAITNHNFIADRLNAPVVPAHHHQHLQ